MKRSDRIPAIVIGGTGYVAGEFLRLLAGHPAFEVHAAVSESAPDTPIAATFPHLLACYGNRRFAASSAPEHALSGLSRAALFGAGPHGASAKLLDDWMSAASKIGCDLRVVDTSADYRFRDAGLYEKIYGKAHGAPERLGDFICALPDMTPVTPKSSVAHPGCFTTAVTLAVAPLHSLSVASPHFLASAVTGSSGSGRTPIAGTHHPERHGNYRAYQPLVHRHRREMEMLASSFGGESASIAFVPHSGPFARGIHATIAARLLRPLGVREIVEHFRAFYAATPFVDVGTEPPTLKDVCGSNMAKLSVHVEGDDVVICSVIDNLVKGAAGGAIQWMNRLFDLEATTGLLVPALAWS